ncbi:unnamed protein product [Orchesella dallaii]|uniref:Cytochrome P450 n=1 Tax=Orchesella dallaii TaxID=48710 RepID=A0ABP1R0Q1_9HEXA
MENLTNSIVGTGAHNVSSILYTLFIYSTLSLVAIISYIYNKKRRASALLKHIDGPNPIPIFGNAFIYHRAAECLESFMVDCSRKYKNRMKIWALWKPYVFLYNAADIKRVLQNTKFLDKGPEYKIFTWIGEGLLTAKGDRWLKTRPIIDHSFHHRVLGSFQDTFNEKCMLLVDVLRKETQQSKQLNIFPHIFHCGFDIICETLMNTKMNTLEGVDENVYSKHLDRAADFFHYRQWRPMTYNNPLGKLIWRLSRDGREEAKCLHILNEFSRNLLKTRRQARKEIGYEKSKNMNVPLIDLLLDYQEKNPGSFTDEQIRDEIDTFLTGGHGATTATTGFAVFIFGCYPEIQQRVYEELDTVFNGDPSKRLTNEDLNKLPYLDLCLKECLRMFPGVPFFPRELGSDLELADGTIVPKDSIVIISPYLLHRNTEAHSEPYKFLPERHQRIEGVTKDPYNFIPFSAGPRYCIGKQFSLQETKTFLAYLLYNFRIEPVGKLTDLEILARVFLKSNNGIPVILHPRNEA